MPRNLKGGNKAKKKANKDNIGRGIKDMVYPNEEENSHIAKVIKVLGDKRFTIIYLSDTGYKNEEMMAVLSRTASKRQGRIISDSIVKVSKRDFEDKCDILYQYNPEQVQTLINEKHISIEEKKDNNEDTFEFSNDNDDNDLDIENI